MPIDGSWSDNFPSKAWTVYTVNEGHSWKSSWWPATGNRNRTNAILYYIGTNGYYWSSSSHSEAYKAYNLYFDYATGVNPSHSYNRSRGYSIRCIEEGERLSESRASRGNSEKNFVIPKIITTFVPLIRNIDVSIAN